MGSLLAIGIALASALGFVVVARRHGDLQAQAKAARDLTWADPEARPRF
jgi:hypothetical protein